MVKIMDINMGFFLLGRLNLRKSQALEKSSKQDLSLLIILKTSDLGPSIPISEEGVCKDAIVGV